jgi:hypothetical protein
MGDQPSVSGRMEGHGYYTKHSRAQRAFGQLGLDWIEAAAAAVEPPAAGLPFVIVDLGAAGGGSSLEPMRRALAARSSPGPALVVHTDIPSNDFSALFELVLNSPATYLGPPGVFALAAGRSFYDGLFPDNFVSLGWSSIAVHWLSRVSVPITGHIYCSFAKGAIRAAIRDQSAADWMAFLGHRARELRPTGRLVIMGGAARDDGTSGAEGLMDAANDSLRMNDGVRRGAAAVGISADDDPHLEPDDGRVRGAVHRRAGRREAGGTPVRDAVARRSLFRGVFKGRRSRPLPGRGIRLLPGGIRGVAVDRT